MDKPHASLLGHGMDALLARESRFKTVIDHSNAGIR
jgi:hypothetical protein